MTKLRSALFTYENKIENWLRKVTHSFEVHSNERSCRKKVRLGLEQVYSHHKTSSSENKTCLLVPRNHTCTLPPTIDEAPTHQILSGHPSLQPFHWNILIGEHCNHHRLTLLGPWTYQIFVPSPCTFPLQRS